MDHATRIRLIKVIEDEIRSVGIDPSTYDRLAILRAAEVLYIEAPELAEAEIIQFKAK